PAAKRAEAKLARVKQPKPKPVKAPVIKETKPQKRYRKNMEALFDRPTHSPLTGKKLAKHAPRNQDPAPVPINGGFRCKCGEKMQRYTHSPDWRPRPGRGYHVYYDKCPACTRTRNYNEAKEFKRPVR